MSTALPPSSLSRGAGCDYQRADIATADRNPAFRAIQAKKAISPHQEEAHARMRRGCTHNEYNTSAVEFVPRARGSDYQPAARTGSSHHGGRGLSAVVPMSRDEGGRHGGRAADRNPAFRAIEAKKAIRPHQEKVLWGCGGAVLIMSTALPPSSSWRRRRGATINRQILPRRTGIQPSEPSRRRRPSARTRRKCCGDAAELYS